MKKIFTPRQKAVVALESMQGVKMPNQLAGEYENPSRSDRNVEKTASG